MGPVPCMQRAQLFDETTEFLSIMTGVFRNRARPVCFVAVSHIRVGKLKNVTASEMDRRPPPSPLAPGRRLKLGLQASLASARPGRPYSEGLRHVGPPPGARVRSVSGWLRQKQKEGARRAPMRDLGPRSRRLVRILIGTLRKCFTRTTCSATIRY